jgi:acyl-ACP thioesterase
MQNTQVQPITEKSFHVRSFDCDASTHLRLSSLCEYLQETSLLNAERHGINYLDLIKGGHTLVISRMKIRIGKLPLWGEDVTVSTWLKGYHPEKVAWNDYEMKDAGGNPIVWATSSWLVVDLKTGKSIPFAEAPFHFTEYAGREALPGEIDILDPKGMPSLALTKPVLYSDIDLNRHVNNCRYADWVLDALTPEEIKTRRVRSLQMNYLSQIPYGTKVRLMRFPASTHHVTVFGINEANPDQVHFQARIGFEG